MNPDEYNVSWNSPSAGPSGSMPIGNGDVGANIWVEAATGDLLLLLAKTDAWDENGILLKPGRLRISLDPPLWDATGPFRQTLRLADGAIEIAAGPAGDSVTCRVRVSPHRPIVRVAIESDRSRAARVRLESWRTAPRVVKTQTGDLFKNLVGKNSDPHPTVITPDVVLSRDDTLLWCHHNGPLEHDGYTINMRLQGLGEELARRPHPLRGRTFGAAVRGAGFRLSDATTLAAPPAPRHELAISVHAEHPGTVASWTAGALAVARAPAAIEVTGQNAAWSGIEVWSDDPAERDGAFRVSRAYALQRHLNAAAGRGAQPIKHNGSIFSVGQDDDADFRRWGPGYWFMNQRLVYWPMLADGDFDLMRPFFRMYRDCLDLQQARTRRYFGHGGGHYPETIYFWGAEVSGHYGWTPFEQRAHPEAECAYLTYYWSGGIELVLMMLEYFEHTLDEAFLADTLLPVAEAVIEFFDLHYPRDPAGRIRFEPAQALETWHKAINPTPEIAGLRYVLPRVGALLSPSPRAPGADRGEVTGAGPHPNPLPAYRERELMRRCFRMLDELPELPLGISAEGRRVVLPAKVFDVKKNTENPELYCVFPYRLFGVGKPDLQLARDTFANRRHVEHTCWHQDVIQMALLGLAEEAKASLIRRAAAENHSDSRFPGFWNAFHDWVPDIDHGGVLQIALQRMLMQCEGDAIRLLPAWPKGWNARFRLHAPRRTVVSGEVIDGALRGLVVEPPERERDVERGVESDERRVESGE